MPNEKMKFRSKKIINGGIIAFWILLIFGLLIDVWTRYLFIWAIVICIVLLIYWYNNYIELDDVSIKQLKCNLFFQKNVHEMPYKDIVQMQFGKNRTFSSEDVWEERHFLTSVSWEIMEIGKLLNFKKFKNELEGKQYLMVQYVWDDVVQNWNTFTSYEWWFIRLAEESLFISKNHLGEKNILTIKYSDIMWIEVVILSENSENDGCCYIKLKDQKFKEAFYGIQDCHAFVDALKSKWINAYFVSSDEIISDLKDEDLY